MTNYSIYKITNENFKDDMYVGSTKRTLDTRMNNHKSACKGGSTSKLYLFIRNNDYVWGNWKIEEIFKFDCENKRMAESVEQDYINLLKPSLNQRGAHTNNKEWKRTKKMCSCCNCYYRNDNRSHHFKSLKHINNSTNL